MRRILGALITVAFLAGFSGSAAAEPGDFDMTFGLANGATVSGFNGTSTVSDARPAKLITLSDGSTLSVLTTEDRTVVLKRRADGTRDTTFGSSGTLLVPAIEDRLPMLEEVARQGDDFILFSSDETYATGKIFAQRFDGGTGQIDQSFGINSTVTLDPAARAKPGNRWFALVEAESDSRGRIYLAGNSSNASYLIRLNPDGSRDASFGKKGIAKLKPGKCERYLSDMAISARGIYLSSTACAWRFTLRGKQDSRFSYRPARRSGEIIFSIAVGPDQKLYLSIDPEVRRLKADGSVDRSFGKNGLASPRFPGGPFLSGLTFDSAGRLLLIGDEFSVARLTSGGKPDLSFGDRGYSFNSLFPQDASGFVQIAETPSGEIVGLASRYPAEGTFSYLSKISSEGILDTSFGPGGALQLSFEMPVDDGILDTATTNAGGTVAVGRSGDRATVTKYLPDGKTDTSFGNGGGLRFSVGNDDGSDSATSLAIGADDSVLVCVETDPGVTLVRFDIDGDQDPSFGQAGRQRFEEMTRCAGLAILPTGKILLAGLVSRKLPGVARLNDDGSIDSSYGTDGWAYGPMSRGNPRVAFTELADGGALIAGRTGVAKFSPEGAPVAGFGAEGKVRFDGRKGLPYQLEVVDIESIPGGETLLLSRNFGTFLITKLKKDGSLAKGYGFGGSVQINTKKARTLPADMELQGDGRLVVVASGSKHCVYGWACRRTALLYRLTTDGQLDRSFSKKGVKGGRYSIGTVTTSLLITPPGYVVGGYAETSESGENFVLFRALRGNLRATSRNASGPGGGSAAWSATAIRP